MSGATAQTTTLCPLTCTAGQAHVTRPPPGQSQDSFPTCRAGPRACHARRRRANHMVASHSPRSRKRTSHTLPPGQPNGSLPCAVRAKLMPYTPPYNQAHASLPLKVQTKCTSRLPPLGKPHGYPCTRSAGPSACPAGVRQVQNSPFEGLVHSWRSHAMPTPPVTGGFGHGWRM